MMNMKSHQPAEIEKKNHTKLGVSMVRGRQKQKVVKH
jgi:hypothetical protein